MHIKNTDPDWKEKNTLEILGLVLIIPISFIVFNMVLKFIFRGFTDANPESTLMVLRNILYCCLGATMAIYIYKIKKGFLIVICSFAVLFALYYLLRLTFEPAPVMAMTTAIFSELAWVYATLISFILLFRYSEMKLDYAEARDIVEKIEKKTNLKYDSGICTKCGHATVIAKERDTGGSKKMVFFCDNCGRFIKGNPLTGVVLGAALTLLAIIFLYGMNAGSGRSAGGTLNLLFAIILYLGVRSLYMGVRTTYKAGAKKNTPKE